MKQSEKKLLTVLPSNIWNMWKSAKNQKSGHGRIYLFFLLLETYRHMPNSTKWFWRVPFYQGWTPFLTLCFEFKSTVLVSFTLSARKKFVVYTTVRPVKLWNIKTTFKGEFWDCCFMNHTYKSRLLNECREFFQKSKKTLKKRRVDGRRLRSR